MNDLACRKAYDAFHGKYELEWEFREKPISYFGSRSLMLKMWSYRRTSFEGMKKAYLLIGAMERTKKKSLADRVKTCVVLFVFGILKR